MGKREKRTIAVGERDLLRGGLVIECVKVDDGGETGEWVEIGRAAPMERAILELAWLAFNDRLEGTGTDEEARMRRLLDEATAAAA